MKVSTLLAKAGSLAETTGHVTPPIPMSANYGRDRNLALIQAGDYTRDGSPLYPLVEELLTKLDGGASSLVFPSGMAAAHAVLSSMRPGDRLVLPTAGYFAFRKSAARFAKDWGLDLSVADMTKLDDVTRALEGGKNTLVWVESPSNPTWDVPDIAAVGALCKRAGASLVVDSTVATPIHTRPLELGASIVMHSATKYLNGHSDALGGALITREQDERWERIRTHRKEAGSVLGNVEAWLLLRGLKTLHVRVMHSSASALAIATALEAHPALAALVYPGLASHPEHAVAAKQMKGGFSGMMSFRFRDGEAAALAFVKKLELFVRATSLGATESLAEHRASVEGEGSGTPRDLVRLSIGLEDAGDLEADLRQALDAAKA